MSRHRAAIAALIAVALAHPGRARKRHRAKYSVMASLRPGHLDH
jgi:hypothetical protein